MPSFVEPIVAVRISLAGHTGITLYAPPWQDADGDEWQGFLGDGAKIVLLGTVDELNTWLGDHPDHDLADHPAWPAFATRGKRALEPAEEAQYDLDEVYELAAGEPDPESVSKLADTVDMATRIADCCEDGMLRAVLTGTEEYVLLTESETDYHSGKEGRAAWSALGDTVAGSWERVLSRTEFWLRWEGSSAIVHEAAGDEAPGADD